MMKSHGQILNLKIEVLGRKYESFRFVAPKVEEKLLRSLRRDGQLSPISVVDEEKIYQLVDGFKRARAAEEIPELEKLEAKCIDSGSAKAVMLRLNLDRKGFDPVEEGLLMKALHRDDGMAQGDIAGLVGRHRSWVCRRIALVERLDPEVVENLRLGLINPSQGRSLALLPRGNQQAVQKEILASSLSSRDTATLVGALNKEGLYDLPQIKAESEKIRMAKQRGDQEEGSGEPIMRMLCSMKTKCRMVTDYLEAHPEWVVGEEGAVKAATTAARGAAEQLDERLAGGNRGERVNPQ